MKPKKLVSALAAIGFTAGLALASGPASAVIQIFSPITAFQDDNLDLVVDNNNDGIINQGDRIISVLEFVNTQGTLPGQGPTDIGPLEELTGVADITVATVLGDGTLVFAPSGAAGLLAGFAAGTMVAIWRDPTPDLNVINGTCGNLAACTLAAGLGAGDPLYLTAGFTGDPDELWVSDPIGMGANIAAVEAGGSSSIFGLFNYSLTSIVNMTGLTLQQQPCAPFCGPGGNGLIQITGSGTIFGGAGLPDAVGTTQWTGRSDNDTQIAVPEPGSLALLGAALAALGWGSRRRRMKA
jgi:hypothetical protein